MTGTDLEPAQSKAVAKPAPAPVALDQYVALLARDTECADAIKRWETERVKVREAIAKVMGDAEVGTVEGEEVLIFRAVNTFNGSGFKKDYPDLYKMYTRTMEVEKFDTAWFESSRPDLYEQYQSRPMKNSYVPAPKTPDAGP